MKAVMKSVTPRICEKVANGDCTILVSKTAPKCEVPFKCYIYCTKKKPFLGFHTDYVDGTLKKVYTDHLFGSIPYFNGKVIGEFICDKVDEIVPDYNPVTAKFYYGYVADTAATCLSEEELQKYGKNKSLYFWHISDLKIYGKPKELSEFYTIDESGNDCCIACVYHETPIEEMPCRTCTGERKYLYRPPQSYMYVEEL